MKRAVLLDVDGVLTVSWQPIPGAVDAVRSLREAGIALRLLTNTTSVTAAEIVVRLGQVGIPVDLGELLTAAVATAAHLREHHAGARCLLLDEGPTDDLAGVELAPPGGEHADVVVVGSGGPSLSWDALNTALRCLRNGAELVSMHGSPVWRTAEGECLDGAAFAAMLESVTGAVATVIGKPAAGMFEAALRSVGCEAGEALMVGDDARSDVLAAQQLGIEGVLVRTGKFRPEILDGLEPPPDHVVDSIADVPALVCSSAARPT